MTTDHTYGALDQADNIITPFMHSLSLYPDSPALWVDKQTFSYRQLYQITIPVAQWIQSFPAQRTLVFSQRTLPAYQAILASLLAGKAYVPLNPKMPPARNEMMMDLADSNLVVADYDSLDALMAAMNCFTDQHFDVLLLNVPEHKTIPTESHQARFHTLSKIQTLNEFTATLQKNTDDDACLLFTSGSTGKPKGVMLSHGNILSYLCHTVRRYAVTQTERISQMTELTFDFSVQDIFMAWSVGACVYAFPEDYFIGLPKYLNENQISFMTTVPSTARLLDQLGKLTPNSLPHLRQNIFGGEPFADSIATRFQAAAPNTQVNNVCGPTEATIAYLAYPWDKQTAQRKGPRDCIPLGQPLPGQDILLADSEFNPVANGEIGELYLAGPQVIKEYWRNPALTAERFIRIPDENGHIRVWYKTGDIVLWDDEDGIIFKGRVDDQLQIRGCRVEKLEIERVVREVAKTENTAVLPWPVAEDGTVQGVIAYVSNSPLSPDEIYKACRQALPDYMAPKEVFELDKLPLNFNGKIDYLKLKQYRASQQKECNTESL